MVTECATRVLIGRDVVIVRETFNGLTLEGLTRLAPGRHVEIRWRRPRDAGATVRRALVSNWEVVALGRQGPVYRGFCRWE